MTQDATTMLTLFERMQKPAEDAGVFDSVTVEPTRIRCLARGSAEPAEFRGEHIDGVLWVSLSTEDRWLSGSIEEELMNSGDDLNELIEEELIEQGCDNPPVAFEHFRDPELRYTFRSKIPAEPNADEEATAAEAVRWLLGYEAAFRELGDMSPPDED